jgi:glycosyltransferase involved in cell wall biosynthesis
MRVLVMTSEWPSQEFPNAGIFVVGQVEAMRKLEIKIDVLNFRGRKNPLRYFKAFLEMRRSLSMRRYDLIHAHFGQAGFLSILQKRVPTVVTFHGSDLFGLAGVTLLSRLKSNLLKFVSQIAARRANEIILVSERLLNKLPSRHINVIPMGTDLSLFRPTSQKKARESLGWPLNEQSILFVANPANPIKRYELASEAVAIAAQFLPNAKLRVCYNEPQDRVPIYMNASDVLIVTSLHESGPLVVREALACNLAVVSVDVGDVRQRMGSIEGCIICENDLPEIIADGLVRALEHGSEINGRVAVLDLDERYIAQKLLDLYVLVLKRNGANPFLNKKSRTLA